MSKKKFIAKPSNLNEALSVNRRSLSKESISKSIDLWTEFHIKDTDFAVTKFLTQLFISELTVWQNHNQKLQILKMHFLAIGQIFSE